MTNKRLQRLVLISVFGALAFILTLLEVHIPPFAAFLKYDAGDIPAMVAAYGMGPVVGLGVQALKAVLFLLSGRSESGWVGVLANFLAGGALVLGAGLMQQLLERTGTRSWGWSILSAVVGTLVMTAVLIPVNALLVYPLFGMKGAAAWSGALTISTPFNLFKGLVSCGISVPFYYRLQPFMAGIVKRQAA